MSCGLNYIQLLMSPIVWFFATQMLWLWASRDSSWFLHLFFEVFDPDPGLKHGPRPCHQALPGISLVNQLPFHDVTKDETFLQGTNNEDMANPGAPYKTCWLGHVWVDVMHIPLHQNIHIHCQTTIDSRLNTSEH